MRLWLSLGQSAGEFPKRVRSVIDTIPEDAHSQCYALRYLFRKNRKEKADLYLNRIISNFETQVSDRIESPKLILNKKIWIFVGPKEEISQVESSNSYRIELNKKKIVPDRNTLTPVSYRKKYWLSPGNIISYLVEVIEGRFWTRVFDILSLFKIFND